MAKFQSRLSTRLAATTALALLGAGLFSASTHGQSADGEIIVPDTIQLPKRFVKGLTRQPDHDQRLLRALQQFEHLDLDGDGVSQEDLDRKDRMQAAQARSAIVQRYLTYDLNADGVVAREEMENVIVWKSRGRLSRSGGSTSARLRLEQQVKKKLEPFEKADQDGNGQLDVSELLQLAKSQDDAQGERRAVRRHHSLEGSIMLLDFNSDGVVSESEFIAAISSLTPDSTMGHKPEKPVRIVEPGCLAPQVQPDEKLVLFGTYNGAVMSNVTILGQDKPTWTAEVVIKDGAEPLYVVLTSYDPIIWRFTGATDRVRNVVLSARPGTNRPVVGSGLTGVEKATVSFVSGPNCLTRFQKAGGVQEARAKARVREVIGREPDYALAQRDVTRVTLPDGPIDKVTRVNRPRVRLKIGSGEVPVSPTESMKIDASEVVSQTPAADYEVLPREAGLAQLLNEGKIERMDDGSYKIKQKIRIPAGLTGGHRVKFLLPKGVPEPIGSPGHSCVFSEETGRIIGHAGLCR